MKLRWHRTPARVTQATPQLGQTLEVVAAPDPDPNQAASALATSTAATWPARRWRR